MERDVYRAVHAQVEKEAFVDFCVRHRDHLDDSWLVGEDLDAFLAGEGEPAVLAWAGDHPVGAASLLLDDYHLRGRRARFRILYSETETAEAYAALLAPLRAYLAAHHSPDVDVAAEPVTWWFTFVRKGNELQQACLEANGFRVQRVSYLLERAPQPVPVSCLPEGVAIRPFVEGCDEETYCRIRNAAFRTLNGSETPLEKDDVTALLQEERHLPGGIFLLETGGATVGLVRGTLDPEADDRGPALEIGPLAILPAYQGKGYGTCLLREALRFGVAKGLERAVLSVNAENAAALGLYEREGFALTDSFACLQQDLGADNKPA